MGRRRRKPNPSQKKWSREVRERDMWQCQMPECECEGKDLIMAYRFVACTNQVSRYDINNGVALCPKCLDRILQNGLEGYYQSVFTDIVRRKQHHEEQS